MSKTDTSTISPISPAAISRHYEALDRIGSLGPRQGFLRAAWSDEETAAMRHIESAAKAGGLACRWDAVGNLIVETPGNFSEWIETGSHMDTVPGGGNYDGAAGVVAGLEAILAIQNSGVVLQRGLRLRAWRGEESSTFGVVSGGSRAAFGLLNPAVLSNVYSGRTLAEAIREQGGDPFVIERGEAAVSQAEAEGIAAYLEMHIEQGSVLETGGFRLGVVTGIRGSIRSWVKLSGAFDHSGATPMGRPWRRDVNLAMAYMQVRLDALANKAIEAGEDIVQTVGVVNSNRHLNDTLPGIDSNAVAKVSGAGYFSHEVRGCYSGEVRTFVDEARQVIMQTAAEFGVAAEIEEFSEVAGIARMDDGLQHLLAVQCQASEAKFTRLPSGAWHDAAVLHEVKREDGSKIPVGMLFVPCRGGISHSPEEYASLDDLALGATVLASAMLELAS